MTTKRKPAATRLHVILEKAKKLLTGHWTQGKYYYDPKTNTNPEFPRDGCHYCAIGAVHATVPEGSQADEAARRVLHDTVEAGRSGCSGVLTFNDKPGRTEKQVLTLYDRAIARAKKQDRRMYDLHSGKVIK